MTYQKPEILHLGAASLLIQGNKPSLTESNQPLIHRGQPDSELDD